MMVNGRRALPWRHAQTTGTQSQTITKRKWEFHNKNLRTRGGLYISGKKCTVKTSFVNLENMKQTYNPK